MYGGIPKYHLAGHTDACYAQYSLNNMKGVGRLDAEGCERAWADLNQAARSTSEKGPGFRIDSLNHCMHDWNWKKTTGMSTPLLLCGQVFCLTDSTILTATQLTKKWDEAHRMAEEQEDMWTSFSNSLEAELVTNWSNATTEPTKSGSTWTSLFLMKESARRLLSAYSHPQSEFYIPADTSVTRAVLGLNNLEAADNVTQEATEHGFTAPAWVSEGIEIEIQQ
jgi:hypothetical protein